MKYKSSIEIYRKYMFMYGILTILELLQHFENIEEYEECQKIIDAIKEQEIRLNTTLYTKITKEAINEVIETYKKFNLTGKNALENSIYYKNLILNEII